MEDTTPPINTDKKDNTKKRRVSRRQKLLIIGGAIVVLAIAGTAVFLLTRPASEQAAVVEEEQPALEDNRSEPRKKADAVADEALASGDPEKIQAAIDNLATLRESDEPDDAKAEYLMTLVSICMTTERHEEALTYALELEQLQSTAVSAGLVASAYGSLDNFTEAAKYYQFAVDRSEKVDDPTKDSPYNDYMILKTQMEERL